AAAAAPEAPAKTGGTVDVVTDVTDTHERKEILGYRARHLQVEITRHSSPNACNPVDDKIQIDGWYIDDFEMPSTPPSPQEAAALAASEPACRDEVRNQAAGTKPGFPVDYTVKR